MDYSNINNALNAPEVPAAPATAKVSIVSLGGVNEYEITAGMTVGDFKSRYGLDGTKVVDQAGNTLENTAILSSDVQLFVSTPKKNG
jgi:hypothetical protein